MSSRFFTFSAVASGPWRVLDQITVSGPSLPGASHIRVQAGPDTPAPCDWFLRGITATSATWNGPSARRWPPGRWGWANPVTPAPR